MKSQGGLVIFVLFIWSAVPAMAQDQSGHLGSSKNHGSVNTLAGNGNLSGIYPLAFALEREHACNDSLNLNMVEEVGKETEEVHKPIEIVQAISKELDLIAEEHNKTLWVVSLVVVGLHESEKQRECKDRNLSTKVPLVKFH